MKPTTNPTAVRMNTSAFADSFIDLVVLPVRRLPPNDFQHITGQLQRKSEFRSRSADLMEPAPIPRDAPSTTPSSGIGRETEHRLDRDGRHVIRWSGGEAPGETAGTKTALEGKNRVGG